MINTEPTPGCLIEFLKIGSELLNSQSPAIPILLEKVETIPGWQYFEQIILLSSVALSFDEGKFAEIGCWHGRSFATFLLSNRFLTGYAVDTFSGTPGEHEELLKDIPNLRAAFEANLDKLKIKDRAIIQQGCSTEMWKLHENESLDFIFIDGNHTYEFVTADINNWYPKLKTGGLMLGHDYNHISVTQFAGLRKAVDKHVRFNDRFKDFGAIFDIWAAIKK